MPRISPTGSISQQVGPASISVNPLTQTAGVGTSANLVNSGDVNLNVGVGAGFGPGGAGFGVTPNLQFGDSPNAQVGSQVGGGVGGLAGGIIGGPLGAAGGSLVGSGVGSLIGGAFGGGSSQKNKEHKSRNSFINRLREFGLLDDNYQLALPDGSVATFEGGAGMTHAARDPSKLVGEKRSELFGFETDYTNDLDYVASMGGITLARMLGGGKDKAIDQTGNLIGNQALGKLGYGQDFNASNFNQVSDNLRAMYAQSGIKSKDEFLALANQAYTQGRFNDADRAVSQQVADLIFDKDFGKASQLMAGRWKGLDTASQRPGKGGPGPRKGTIFTGRDTGIKGGVYAPIISFEEALLSVKPAIDYAYSVRGKPAGPNSLQSFVNNLRGGADIIKGVGGLYNAIDELTSGGVSDFIGGLFDGGGGELAESAPFDFGAGQGDIDISEDFSLGTGDELQLDLGGSDVSSGDTLDFTLDF